DDPANKTGWRFYFTFMGGSEGASLTAEEGHAQKGGLAKGVSSLTPQLGAKGVRNDAKRGVKSGTQGETSCKSILNNPRTRPPEVSSRAREDEPATSVLDDEGELLGGGEDHDFPEGDPSSGSMAEPMSLMPGPVLGDHPPSDAV